MPTASSQRPGNLPLADGYADSMTSAKTSSELHYPACRAIQPLPACLLFAQNTDCGGGHHVKFDPPSVFISNRLQVNFSLK